MKKYTEAIQEAIPEKNITILGRPNDWFAFFERPFFVTSYMGNLQPLLQKELILIEGDLYRNNVFPELKKLLQNKYKRIDQKSFEGPLGEKVSIFYLKKNDEMK